MHCLSTPRRHPKAHAETIALVTHHLGYRFQQPGYAVSSETVPKSNPS